jgi:parallel beta-helix repeat protein
MAYKFNPFTGKLDITEKSYTPATKVVATASSGFKADYYTDGVADDVEINAALAASSGGSVLIKAGTYNTTQILLIPSSCSVRGEGMGVTTISLGAAKGFKNTNYLTTGDSNISVSDITIDGNGLYDTHVEFFGVQNGIIERVHFYNITVALPAVTVACGIVGLSGIETRNITVKNCYFDTISDYGVNLDPLSTHEVLRDVIITGNHFNEVETGIACQRNCNDIDITNNVYKYSSATCIGVKACPGADATNPGRNINISNNIFESASLDTTFAISIGNVTYNAIAANNIVRGFNYGVYLNFHPNYTLVENNNISACNIGITDVSEAEHTSVIGNYLYGCGSYGIMFDTPLDIISNNTVSNSGLHGIYLTGQSDNVIVSGNNSDHNGTSGPGTYSGIYLDGVTNAVITANHCYDSSSGTAKTQAYGIQTVGTADFNTIMNNNCRGNSVGTMTLVGTANEIGHNIGYFRHPGFARESLLMGA